MATPLCPTGPQSDLHTTQSRLLIAQPTIFFFALLVLGLACVELTSKKKKKMAPYHYFSNETSFLY